MDPPKHDIRALGLRLCQSITLPHLNVLRIAGITGRRLAAVAVTDELGILRFLAETYLNRSRQTSVRPGGEKNSKGQHSSLSLASKYWSAREFNCVGLTVLGR